jgi:hypothetical protein
MESQRCNCVVSWNRSSSPRPKKSALAFACRPHSLSMFEAVINAVHRAAPNPAIAFNTRPQDSADAAAGWVKAD